MTPNDDAASAGLSRPTRRPLDGIRVVEIAGIGPAPFAATVLGDLGAEVVRVDRVSDVGQMNEANVAGEVLNRNRRSIAVDLKHPDGVATVLRMVAQADVLIEGFRPGVAERLGIGPEDCRARNPGLIYGRMTGWGQTGPLANTAGHDIDYIAVAGALDPIGRPGMAPVPPLNLVGDMGGGAMFLVVGVLAALVGRAQTGRGEVIDAAMVDGAAMLTAMFHGFIAKGTWNDERGTNTIDGGAFFYDVYATADGQYMAVGAVEAKFFEQLLALTGLDGDDSMPRQWDKSRWEEGRARLAEVFVRHTRAEWCERIAAGGFDACVAPVMSLREAPEHPHNVARSTFVEVAGVCQPAPMPIFEGQPAPLPTPPAAPGEHTADALQDWGFSQAEVDELRTVGAIA